MRKGLKQVEKELEFHRSQGSSGQNGDRFVVVMKEFITMATYKFSELEDAFQDMKQSVRAIFRVVGQPLRF